MTKNDLLNKAEEYMKTKYRFEFMEDESEGGYIISYPDLIGCISTGETIEEAVKNGEDARREWIIATLESKQIVVYDKENNKCSDWTEF